MEKLKVRYNQIAALSNVFGPLESLPRMLFLQRRYLRILNEALAKELRFMNEEIEKLAEEYCQKDKDGKFILTENNERKVKENFFQVAAEKLADVYNTEVEIDYQPFKFPASFYDCFPCDAATYDFIVHNFIEEEIKETKEE